MRPRSWQKHTAAGVLLLQLLLAGLLPLASAHETADLSRIPHLEDVGGSSSCPRNHDHYLCVTSRLLATTSLLVVRGRSAEPVSTIRIAPATRLDDALPHQARPAPVGSRAPPLV
jgi:hypothetical protein